MSLIVWNEQLRVGVDIIDAQHKELVRMANELADAMKTGHGRDVLGKLFADLTAYTASHFATEERLMREHCYPAADDHRRQHDELRRTVAGLADKAKAGSVVVSLETMLLLRDWLSRHIQHSDRELARHLSTRGVAAARQAA